MFVIKSTKLIDFLWANGVKPEYEIFDLAFYHKDENLFNMMDRYYIQSVCIPNKGGKY